MNHLEPDLYGIKAAKGWLEKCSRHELCNSTGLSSPTSRLPRRLLNIGAVGTRSLRLVLTDDLKAGDYRYVALSHCWGDPTKIFKTTAANIMKHYTAIEWKSLSRTFQQAIVVTQLLGLHYIWIDSLCIIQGDPADFGSECARMHIVYLNCYCMIAANDAKDGDEGFLEFWDDFDVHNPSQVLSEQHLVNVKPAFCPLTAQRLRGGPYHRPHRSMEWEEWLRTIRGPLSTRGWAFQERQLAPRVLHYTRSGILWECRICVGAGDSPNLEYRRLIHADTKMRARARHSSDESRFRILDRQFTTALKGGMLQWRDLVEEYSRKFITFPGDKLPALSALAATITELTTEDLTLEAGQYLAGIWEADMHRQLLWYPVSYLRPRSIMIPDPTSNMPSWSWASCRGSISFDVEDCFREALIASRPSISANTRFYDDCCNHSNTRYISTDICPLGGDRYGNITGSEIVLFGQYEDYIDPHPIFTRIMRNLSSDGLDSPHGLPDLWRWKSGELPPGHDIFAIFDTNSPPSSSSGFLRIVYLIETYLGGGLETFGLVLQATKEGGFRRIGICCHPCESLRRTDGEEMRLV